MNCNNHHKYYRLGIILLLITALTGIAYYYSYQEEINTLDSERENVKKNIIDSFSLTLRHVSESANHITTIMANQIQTKNLTLPNFNQLTEFNIYPFRDSLQNMRFSPLVYADEVDEHIAFSITQFPGYQIKPYLIVDDNYDQNNPFFVPVYSSNPLFFVPSVFGIDLYNISQIRTNFFNKFTHINQTVVSSEILFGNSVGEIDYGIYFGKMVHTNKCDVNSADSFTELVMLNHDSKCLIGFAYLPFLARDFVEGAIDFLLRANQNIVTELKFGVYSNSNNQLLYFPDELLPFNENYLLDDYTDKYFSKFNFPLSNEVITIFLFFSRDIDSDEINHQITLLHYLFISIWIAIMIVVTIIYFLVQKNIQVTEDKYQEINNMVKYVNHELRNPININNGYIDVSIIKLDKIIKTHGKAFNIKDIEEIKNYLQIIKNSNRILSIIINDILDLQKSEKSELQYIPKNFILQHLIDQIIISIQYKIDEHHEIDFITQYSDVDTNIVLYNDENRIIQIIINFLTNSFKHTSEGSITFSAKKINSHVELSVADTGNGIPQNIQDSIFKEKFIGETKTGIRGVGIGLYLCKILTDLIGAQIGFTSQVGKGSKFMIRIPIKNSSTIIDLP